MGIKNSRAHFIGIGGIGMSALAELFHQMDAVVSGSDIKEGKQTKHLSGKGINVYIGHDEKNIDQNIDVIIYSSAIDEKNPEIQKARKLSIPIIPRAEALAEIMRLKRGIAVGGTHGKTTTTSIISAIFLHANYDPTIAVGGRLKLIESTARLGKGPWMVAEADESDGSFKRLHPEISIITNIDTDHLDHFGSFENLQKAFLNFALNIPYYGSAIVNGDDPRVRTLFKGFTKKIYFYGFSDDNDFVLKKRTNRYEVYRHGEKLGGMTLSVPGEHNALNALAACIATHQAGVSWDQCFAGAESYSGVDRRFQLIGEENSIRVFDDYAHHPTEIKATISAVKDLAISGKFHLIYEPHRFTRTRDCWEDYKTCFENCDHLYLADIYPAGEQPIDGIDSKTLCNEVTANASYFSNKEQFVVDLKEKLQPGDLVMTMGAGQVWKMAHQLLDEVKGS